MEAWLVLVASTLVAVGGAAWALRETERSRRRQVVADVVTMVGIVGYIVTLVLLLGTR